MSPESPFQNFDESHHYRDPKFRNFGESQIKMMSPGLV